MTPEAIEALRVLGIEVSKVQTNLLARPGLDSSAVANVMREAQHAQTGLQWVVHFLNMDTEVRP